MKVLLVDDHTLVRKGLAQVLTLFAQGAEVTEAEDAHHALRILQGERHDIALVDVRMPGMDGIQLLSEIKRAWPEMPVIMLTCFDNGEYVKTALAEGASGYLLKDSSPEDLMQAITVALAGSGNVLSPRAVRNLFAAKQQVEEKPEPVARLQEAGLTPRESDILRLLADGSSNREISKMLFLSEKTVKAHLAAIFRKLGVSNRTKAAMIAVSFGMGGDVVHSMNGNGYARASA